MNKEKLFVLPLLFILAFSIPIAFAEDDEDEEFEDDDREGFGIMEREREREHQDEGIPLGTETGNIILYGTITAIIASVGYTAFKIASKKRSTHAHN